MPLATTPDTAKPRLGTNGSSHGGFLGWLRAVVRAALGDPSGTAGETNRETSADEDTQRRDQASVSVSVARVFDTKLTILTEAIEEISTGLERRKKLNRAFEQQIEAEIAECLDLLGKLPYPWREGFQPKMEFLRVSLHKSLLSRRKDRRAEQLAYWDDVTALLEKKRTLLMEYQNLLATRDSLQTGDAT